MSNVALVSIIFGTLIIITRLPTVLAPDAARKFFLDKLFSSTARIRITGLLASALGVVMILAAQGNPQVPALIIFYFGWFLAIFAGFVFLIFTSLFQKYFVRIVENMSLMTLRLLSLLGITAGLVFLYFGLAVL